MWVTPPAQKPLLATTENLDARPKVDVIGGTTHHEGRDGLHARLFRLAHTRLGLTEMDDLNVVTGRIESARHGGFGGDTNRTARVVEDGFCFHGGEDSFGVGVHRATCPGDRAIMPQTGCRR